MTRSNPLAQEVTPHTFLTTASSSNNNNNSSSASSSPTIIFFIPGNPGVVSYYHLFLSLLARELSAGSVHSSSYPSSSSSSSSFSSRASSSSGLSALQEKTKKSGGKEKTTTTAGENQSFPNNNNNNNKPRSPAESDEYIIHGRSLVGFEIPGPPARKAEAQADRKREDGENQSHKKVSPDNGTGTGDTTTARLYGLTEEIEFVERELAECVSRWREHVCMSSSVGEKGATPEQKAKVVLVGHSAGSYIAMEIMRRKQEREKLAKRDGRSEDDDGCYYNDDSMRIIGGIMLFPTVVDIAKSPSGRKLSSLLFIPRLEVLVNCFAKIMSSILPEPLLRQLISIIMNHPRDDVVDITMAFLKSKCGVQQAIHMAADEMRDITADKWNDEVWGISNPETSCRQPSKLVFYFGRDDHWVADQTRDDIVRVRGPKVTEQDGSITRGPKMVVCEDSILHGFCVGHSGIMARKTANFIRDIVNEQDTE